MRRFVVPTVLAAVLVAAPAAFAAETATGTIQSMDTKTHMITLDDGTTYTLPKHMKSALKTGEKVKLSYNVKNGKNEVTKVTVEK